MDASVRVSALQLEGYYVTQLAFTVRPLQGEPQFQMHGGIGVQHGGTFVPDPITVNVQAAAMQHPEELDRWQHILTVTSEIPPERKYPYDFQITLVGYFKVSEQVPPEQREAFVKINAASVLYSAAREALANATGRGPLPCALLPTVVFSLNPEQKQLPLREAKAQAGGKKTTKKAAKKAAKKGATKKTGGKKQQR
jgi:preprotein translocase subunit SecB